MNDKKKTLAINLQVFSGGEGGIRTLERVLAVTRFPILLDNVTIDLYIDSLKKTSLIEKDDNGFYTVKIADIRNVPHDFKCYKIQGLLNLDEKLLNGETHWIFYRTGMYEELKIGDIIRFKVSQTEIRQFRDLTNARNIYPDTLEVL